MKLTANSEIHHIIGLGGFFYFLARRDTFIQKVIDYLFIQF